ncbi:hypothetical protein HPB49_021052 [Dermacentor silvarum]|uniref:Uncharacterized protein n=1 Tax=Dermacentor silvarum TaxID=543639 RepID=A0ACB8E331_DERSI|nr:hypothetical protein HPB49_021052 [Dermacentor silvarum]
MHSCGFPQEGPDAGPGSAAPLFTAASLAQSRCSAVPASGPQPTGSALRANPFPRLRIRFADFPYLHWSID